MDHPMQGVRSTKTGERLNQCRAGAKNFMISAATGQCAYSTPKPATNNSGCDDLYIQPTHSEGVCALWELGFVCQPLQNERELSCYGVCALWELLGASVCLSAAPK